MESIIYSGKFWLSETDPEILKKLLIRGIKKSNFTVFDYLEKFFQPIGYTAIWLLGESHIALHTFPERECAYVEVSSCVEEKFISLKNHLMSNVFNREYNRNPKISEGSNIYLYNYDLQTSRPNRQPI